MRQVIEGTKNDQLAALAEQHQVIKARLKELDKHLALTAAEQLEYAELKKRKLLTKDRIQVLTLPR